MLLFPRWYDYVSGSTVEVSANDPLNRGRFNIKPNEETDSIIDLVVLSSSYKLQTFQ